MKATTHVSGATGKLYVARTNKGDDVRTSDTNTDGCGNGPCMIDHEKHCNMVQFGGKLGNIAANARFKDGMRKKDYDGSLTASGAADLLAGNAPVSEP